jgi:hypothetical protein
VQASRVGREILKRNVKTYAKKNGAKRRGKGRKNRGAEQKWEEKGKCRQNHQEKLESESVGIIKKVQIKIINQSSLLSA